MKSNKLFDAITNIDDKLIEEAKEVKMKKSKRKRLLVLAASLLLIISISLLLKNNLFTDYIKPVARVIYPEAYAYEDFDNWRKTIDENPVDDKIIKAINDFTYKTSPLIIEANEENINYSPLSLYYGLALATTGAEGETERELLDLLGMENSKILSEQSGNLYRQLYKENEIGQLKIANSIWLDKEIEGQVVEFKDSFIENTVKNFYASPYSVDFSDEETAKTMARWIEENTKGTLSPTIETNSDQILSIINTVYFYDQWIDSFDKDNTREDVFHLLNGEEVKADFMNQTLASSIFFRGTNFTRAGLTLKNGGQMIFILPDAGTTPYDLLASPENMREIFEGGQEFESKVVWKLPKFSFGSQLELEDKLKELGVNRAFKPDANFSGITDHMAFITAIGQETYVSIDEEGVEASAFTEIVFGSGALPEEELEMILDRPFIYGITAPNGSLLFIGVCMNPIG